MKKLNKELIVVGDRLSDVEVGTDFDYTADGRKTVLDRDVPPLPGAGAGADAPTAT